MKVILSPKLYQKYQFWKVQLEIQEDNTAINFLLTHYFKIQEEDFSHDSVAFKKRIEAETLKETPRDTVSKQKYEVEILHNLLNTLQNTKHEVETRQKEILRMNAEIAKSKAQIQSKQEEHDKILEEFNFYLDNFDSEDPKLREKAAIVFTDLLDKLEQ